MGIKDKIKEVEVRDRERFIREEIKESIRGLKWRPYEDKYGTGFRIVVSKPKLKFSGEPKNTLLILEVFPYLRDVNLSTLKKEVVAVYGFKIYGRISGNDIEYNSKDELGKMEGYVTASEAKEEALRKLEDILVNDYNYLHNKYTKVVEDDRGF